MANKLPLSAAKTREEAVKLGLTHFYTGVPCEKGHLDNRRVKDKICLGCCVDRMTTRAKNDPNHKTRDEWLTDRKNREVAKNENGIEIRKKKKNQPPSVATTRAEAVSLGLDLYYTGRPCKKGHLDNRHVGNYHCVTCLCDVNLELVRQIPPEVSAKNQQNWRTSNKEYFVVKRLEQQRRWSNENPSYNRDYMRERDKEEQFQLRAQIRHRLYYALKNEGHSPSFIREIGCSIDFLKKMGGE